MCRHAYIPSSAHMIHVWMPFTGQNKPEWGHEKVTDFPARLRTTEIDYGVPNIFKFFKKFKFTYSKVASFVYSSLSSNMYSFT